MRLHGLICNTSSVIRKHLKSPQSSNYTAKVVLKIYVYFISTAAEAVTVKTLNLYATTCNI